MTPIAPIPGPPTEPVADWVRTHQAGLWRFLRALGCPPDRSEDLVQEALLAGLHHGLESWERSRAAAWLRTTARNLFLMDLRAARRRPEVADLRAVEAAWTAAAADADGGEAALAALRACLATLPLRSRQALERRYGQRASRAAMALEFALSENGVKAWLRRIRAGLRRCIERRLGRGEGDRR